MASLERLFVHGDLAACTFTVRQFLTTRSYIVFFEKLNPTHWQQVYFNGRVLGMSYRKHKEIEIHFAGNFLNSDAPTAKVSRENLFHYVVHS